MFLATVDLVFQYRWNWFTSTLNRQPFPKMHTIKFTAGDFTRSIVNLKHSQFYRSSKEPWMNETIWAGMCRFQWTYYWRRPVWYMTCSICMTTHIVCKVRPKLHVSLSWLDFDVNYKDVQKKKKGIQIEYES